MGKRRGQVRSRDRDYIPFGKPEEVLIEYVQAEKVADGRVIEARYVERFRGASTKGITTPNPVPKQEQGGVHPSCKGKPGVGRLYDRDGRSWCRSCYVFRYGQEPPADIVVKVRRPPRPPMTDLEKMMRNFRL
jgi:hypothetical protein